MADAPHPPGPAESGSRIRRGQDRDESPFVGGLAGIFAVTLATFAVAVVAALIAVVVSLVI